MTDELRDQQQETANNDEQATDANPTPVIPEEDIDPDAALLAELQADADKEGKEPEEEGEKPEAKGEPEDPKPKGKDEPEKKPDDQRMVPIERLNEEVDKRRRAEAERDYAKSLKDDAGKQATPDKPEPTVEEQIAALKAERKDVLGKADEGELTLSEAIEKADEIRDKINALQTPPKADPAPNQPSLYFQEQMQKIVTGNPVIEALNKLPQAEQDRRWDFLEAEADFELKQAGYTVNHSSEVYQLAFLQKQADLAAKYAPTWGIQVTEDKGRAPQPRSDQDLTQRREKLRQAEEHPTSLDTLGGGGDKPMVSEAAIMAMTEEELEAAMPDATIRRIMPEE